MPEKLLTIIDAATLLNISEQEVKKLVEKGELPAYKIGGQFLRFRKEQIDAVRNTAFNAKAQAPEPRVKDNENKYRIKPPVAAQPVLPRRQYSEALPDRLLDFFYFKDFYIISAIITSVILWFIVKDLFS